VYATASTHLEWHPSIVLFELLRVLVRDSRAGAPLVEVVLQLQSMSKLLTDPNGVTKLTTTFSLAKLQEVSAWNAQAVQRAPHSAGAKSTASSTRFASIDRAEQCFITNVSAYTHKQAHWINGIRGNDDKHADATISVVSTSRSLSSNWPIS